MCEELLKEDYLEKLWNFVNQIEEGREDLEIQEIPTRIYAFRDPPFPLLSD